MEHIYIYMNIYIYKYIYICIPRCLSRLPGTVTPQSLATEWALIRIKRQVPLEGQRELDRGDGKKPEAVEPIICD